MNDRQKGSVLGGSEFHSHVVPVINDDGLRHVDIELYRTLSDGSRRTFIHFEGRHHPSPVAAGY